jgi:hypothetical protein
MEVSLISLTLKVINIAQAVSIFRQREGFVIGVIISIRLAFN